MLSTGARATEMFTFEAQHLHGNRLILPIEKSKGRRRSRVVYLPDQALEIVRQYAERYPDGPLFRNADGEPGAGTLSAAGSADSDRSWACLDWLPRRFGTSYTTTG